MAITRKEKPEWFALIDKIKALVEIGEGKHSELAEFAGVAKARCFEWISGKVEPKAQTVLMIEKWVGTKMNQIAASPALLAAYQKAIKNTRKS